MKSLWGIVLVVVGLTGCVGPQGAGLGDSTAGGTSGPVGLRTPDEPATTDGGVPGPDGLEYPRRWLDREEAAADDLDRPAIDGAPDLDDGVVLGEGLLFEIGSAVISPAADAVLRAIADQALTQLGPGQRLRVDGYVDQLGNARANERLGVDRANAVASRLLRLAPPLEGLIDTFGHGELDLYDPGCAGECAANRVVVITVTGGGGI